MVVALVRVSAQQPLYLEITVSVFRDAFHARYREMSQEKKEPKTREHFMVVCLFEEIMTSPRKFNETTNNFIKQMNTEFFNNPEFRPTERQTKWLEDLWTK